MRLSELIHLYELKLQHMKDDFEAREKWGHGPYDRHEMSLLEQFISDLRTVEPDDDVWNDADNPPCNSDYVLLKFSNCSVPLVGRYEGNEEDGGNYYIGDDDTPAHMDHMYVDGWMSIPE